MTDRNPYLVTWDDVGRVVVWAETIQDVFSHLSFNVGEIFGNDALGHVDLTIDLLTENDADRAYGGITVNQARANATSARFWPVVQDDPEPQATVEPKATDTGMMITKHDPNLIVMNDADTTGDPDKPAPVKKPLNWYNFLALKFAADNFNFPSGDIAEGTTHTDEFGGAWRFESSWWTRTEYPDITAPAGGVALMMNEAIGYGFPNPYIDNRFSHTASDGSKWVWSDVDSWWWKLAGPDRLR